MTHEEIIEGNRLIAEFMEVIDFSWRWDGIKFTRASSWFMPEYHSSWDWLMPVVEQIESLNYSVEIFKSASYDEPDKIWHKCIIEKMTNWTLDLALEEEDDLGKQYIKTDSKILSVWLAVIEFIKWYNQQNVVVPKEEENEIKHIS